jgi:hypothetical protein
MDVVAGGKGTRECISEGEHSRLAKAVGQVSAGPIHRRTESAVGRLPFLPATVDVRRRLSALSCAAGVGWRRQS